MKSEGKKILTPKSYSKSFKADAVNRVIRTGKSCAEVSRELGLPGNLLSKWRRENLRCADEQANADLEMKPSEMAAEIRRLRLHVEEQKEILK